MSAFDFRNVVNTVRLPDEPFQVALATTTGLLILSEAIGFYLGSALFKIASSLVFVATAVLRVTEAGPLTQLLESEHRSSLLLLAGLLLGALGDILLIPSRGAYRQPPGSVAQITRAKSTKFKVGALAFTLAHTAYTISFLTSIDLSNVSFSLKAAHSEFRIPDFLMTLVFGTLLVDWLGIFEKERKYSSWFEVPEELRSMVGGYIVVIITMVATATAADKGIQRITASWLLMISNLFFAVSVFGAEDLEATKEAGEKKIVRVEWKSTAMGCIIYYGAQLVFVGCL